MNKPELNAIIAGLRFLQGNYATMPREIRALYTDGIHWTEALTLEKIDALCQSINFQEVDLSGSPAKIVLDRVHAVLNGKIWDSDTPWDIASILENAGYTIAGVDDDDGPDGNN